MEKSPGNFLIKLKPFFIFLCFIIFIITVACNIFFAAFKNDLAQAINTRSFRRVTFAKAFYLPPNFIILKNTDVWDDNGATGKKILSIPETRFAFSVPHLFLNKQLHVLSINCASPSADYHDFTFFLKDNFTQILEFLRRLPQQDIALFIKSATLQTKEKNGSSGNIEINFGLIIKDDAVSGAGFIRKNLYLAQNTPLKITKTLPWKYRFKGLLTYGGITLESLELSRENIYCSLMSELNGSDLKITGSAMINTLFNESAYQDIASRSNYDSKLSFNRLMKSSFSEASGSSSTNLYILNLDSEIKFAFPHIEIGHINFLINNNPVQIKGDLSLSKPLSCNLKLQSRFRGLEAGEKGLLKHIAVTALIETEENELNVNGALDIKFLEKGKERLPLEQIELDLKGMKFVFGESPLMKLRLEKLDFFCSTYSNKYRITLSDLNTQLYKLDDKSKLLKFSSWFYGGIIKGAGRFKIHQFTPVINASVNLKGADANKLNAILIHFSKIHGRLYSGMFFKSYPQLELKGTMNMRNGYLKDFEFFKWLADLFNLLSLRKINFRTASTDFFVNETGAGMQDIRLDSPNVKLSGYFKLGENDFVSSVISSSFSRPLLTTSSKLAPLLKLLPERSDLLDFDFQMSGNLHGMNFLWLEDDFKKRVLKAVPDFMERRIERNIERVITDK